MGLDNYPIPCGCGAHSYEEGVPEGFTHREKDPCPFKDDAFPVGMMGSCCWFRGKSPALELAALGKEDLAERMHEDMTAEEVAVFARELRETADRLERQHAGTPDKPKGAAWNGTWDPAHRKWTWGGYSTFEEAIASIREAARWYEKVGRLGYGVRAWY